MTTDPRPADPSPTGPSATGPTSDALPPDIDLPPLGDPLPRRHRRLETRFGPYVLVLDGDAVVGLWREGQAHFPAAEELGIEAGDPAEDPLLERVLRQLAAYLEGRSTAFSLPLAPRGTPFQQRVWERLCEVPFGGTVTYGEIARDLGRPRGAQAVGAAVGRNPISIIVPCHRVLGADGSVTGYAAGTDTKIALLRHEGRLPA